MSRAMVAMLVQSCVLRVSACVYIYTVCLSVAVSVHEDMCVSPC